MATQRKANPKHPGQTGYEFTKEQREVVRALAGCGVRHKDIARVMKISEPTLAKHFEDELADGLAEINAQIAKRLVEKALEGDTTSMIFWLKQKGGFDAEKRLEVSGKDGVPLQVVIWNDADDKPAK